MATGRRAVVRWQAHAHAAHAGTRVIIAGGIGLLVSGITMLVAPWQLALLTGWDAAAAVVVAWVFGVVRGKGSRETAMLATREDDSRAAADLLLVSASVASLAGVGLLLLTVSHESGFIAAATTGVAVLSVVLSWAAVHTVFTLRYARLYYSEGGGIDFHEEADPDYRDFFYVALTIGMTYQVSDTNLMNKTIRRSATLHALLSYLFGTVIVAMMISVVAGLVR